MAQTIGKKELAELVAAKLGGTKKAAGEAIDAVFQAAGESLKTPGTKVTVTGFATFTSELIPEHTAKNNLKGGALVTVPEKLKVKASMSPTIAK